MSARTYLSDALAAVLTSWRVIPAPVDLDAVAAPTAVIYREDVKPGPTFGTRTSSLAVWVLTPYQDPRAAEDPLDGLLDDVLEVLDAIPAVSWSEASRGVYQDRHNAYRISTTLTETKE